MINYLQRPFMIKLIGLVLAFIMVVTILPCSNILAVDFGKSYKVMQRDYPEMVERIKAGGATDTDIELFLTDMEEDVSKRGTLTEANFNSYIYKSLQDVITLRKHRVLFRAMLEQFEEEIDYTLDSGQLHPELIPFRNAVMEAVLEKPSVPGAPSGPGGGGGGISPQQPVVVLDTSTAVSQEIERQLQAGVDTIILNVGKQKPLINIKGKDLNDIWNSSRNLDLQFSGVSIGIPPKGLVITAENTLSVSVDPVGENTYKQLEKKTGEFYEILGQIIEISATTESSIGSTTFGKPVKVTFSYQQVKLNGIDESQLDVYYYNESAQKWEKMNGKVDRNRKTISFTTNHFSKYAIMAYNPTKTVFADLTGHWAEADINSMAAKGLVNGISATKFAPNDNITRAEFVAILLRAMGIPEGNHIQGQFYDVPKNKWYFNAVNSAAKYGLVSGYTNTSFGPEDLVTREQIAVMLKSAIIYKNADISINPDLVNTLLSKFGDNLRISAWAKDSVAVAIEQGIIKGRTANTFAPQANATRAEAAVMINRCEILNDEF